MTEGTVYSERLGAIADEKFAIATERLGVGRFLRAAPITSGLFGQNVFLTTTEGEFVFRGAPHWVDGARHDLWQFTKERFFAELLHNRAEAPAPHPMLLDEKADIFGWPYLIMPRMRGICFSEHSIGKSLSSDEQADVARALGTMLARMQTLQWNFPGDFDLSLTLAPYPAGHTRHVLHEALRFAESAQRNGSWSQEDETWIRTIGDRAISVGPTGRPHVYVHGDYKLNNLSLSKTDGAWQVTGIFDLHESRFGDGAGDLCRQLASYLDFDAALARVFLDNYRDLATPDPTISERMPLYVAADRIRFWEFFTRPPEVASWLKGKTFRGWAEPYVTNILSLL